MVAWQSLGGPCVRPLSEASIYIAQEQVARAMCFCAVLVFILLLGNAFFFFLSVSSCVDPPRRSQLAKQTPLRNCEKCGVPVQITSHYEKMMSLHLQGMSMHHLLCRGAKLCSTHEHTSSSICDPVKAVLHGLYRNASKI